MAIFLDVAVALIVVTSIYSCYRRGFFKSLMSFLSIFISFYVAKKVSLLLAPIIGEYIYPVFEKMVNLDSRGADNVDSLNKFLSEFKFLGDYSGKIDELLGSTQEQVLLMAQNLLRQISENAAALIIFIVAFIVISVLLSAAISILDTVLKLPVIKSVNRLLGLFFGAAVAVLSIYIFVFLVSLALPISALSEKPFITQSDIDNTKVFAYFYEHNPLGTINLNFTDSFDFLNS